MKINGGDDDDDDHLAYDSKVSFSRLLIKKFANLLPS